AFSRGKHRKRGHGCQEYLHRIFNEEVSIPAAKSKSSIRGKRQKASILIFCSAGLVMPVGARHP
ncbi:MAG TPA: hypothetical protein PKX47_11715, partial [Smithellaceae bacterium]|nr:hypothetical protein [Smithellaceae bacterium]